MCVISLAVDTTIKSCYCNRLSLQSALCNLQFAIFRQFAETTHVLSAKNKTKTNQKNRDAVLQRLLQLQISQQNCSTGGVKAFCLHFCNCIYLSLQKQQSVFTVQSWFSRCELASLLLSREVTSSLQTCTSAAADVCLEPQTYFAATYFCSCNFQIVAATANNCVSFFAPQPPLQVSVGSYACAEEKCRTIKSAS